jgi:hypothetical protein
MRNYKGSIDFFLQNYPKLSKVWKLKGVKNLKKTAENTQIN